MDIRDSKTDQPRSAIDNEAGRKAMDLMTWLLVIDMGVRSWWPLWVTPKGFALDIVVVLFAGAVARAWFNWRARTPTQRGVRQKGLAILAGAFVAALLLWVRGRL